jgi:hypothetical protein
MHTSRWALVALCLACLGFAGPSRHDDVRDTMEPMVADLHWLAGQWTGSDGESDWEATYSTAKGGMLVGASKELRDGKTVMFDFERFYMRGAKLCMTPYPFGRESVEFVLTDFDADAQSAVFENPEHDFPNWFRYQRESEDKLVIELKGAMGGSDVHVRIALSQAGAAAAADGSRPAR